MQLSTLTHQAWRAILAHRTLFLLLALGLLFPLWVFWKVAEDIYKQGGFHGDQVILGWLHTNDTATLDAVMLLLSRVGGPVVMPIVGLLIAAALWFRRHRGDALFFALALVGASLINLLIKAIVGRQRPDLWTSITPEGGFSFPSGHAMGSAALACAVIILSWRTPYRWPVVILSVLFALGVGVSRMYLGVHFPSDVLAGWFASIAWVTGLHLIFSKQGTELRELYRGARSHWRHKA